MDVCENKIVSVDEAPEMGIKYDDTNLLRKSLDKT
jgi:hypothetical protein